ncbi:hypothetical protein HYV71_04955 [Candidatus Uhrbacteria bacterium]|nr:hypothetical protein [Candidatus Uhrbacteria bacterium]
MAPTTMLDKNLLQQNIITLLGLQDLPSDRQITLVERIVELVEKRVTLRLMDELDEEQLKKASAIFSTGTDEEKTAFLQSIPNLQQMLEEEVLKIKQELLNETQKIER